MKIMLIGTDPEENLSLTDLASSLEYNMHIADIVPYNWNNVLNNMIDNMHDYDLIGISLEYQNRVNKFLNIAQSIKDKYPDKMIVPFGRFSSRKAADLLTSNPFIDIIVTGESKHTFAEIADNFHRLNKVLCFIKGIAYRNNNEIHINQPRPIENNPDNLPVPKRSDNLKIRPDKNIVKKIIVTVLLTALGILIGCYTDRTELTDSDGDGLYDKYETEIFYTLWQQKDSDNDGIWDCDEDHDNDGVTNIQYQNRHLSIYE